MCAFWNSKEKDGGASGQPELLPPEVRERLTELFKGLEAPVFLELYSESGGGEDTEFVDFTRRFAQGLSELSDRIEFAEYPLDGERAKLFDVRYSPTLLIAPETYDIRFVGAPAGEEARTLIQTVIHASLGRSGLSDVSRQMLSQLDEERDVMVFVSPTCPYCPGQTLTAFRAAVERPKLVRASCIESTEMRELADKHAVGSVPHSVVSGEAGEVDVLGMEPEERFIAEILTLKTADQILKEQAEAARAHLKVQAGEEGEPAVLDLVIVGAGPAGLAAAIYGARAGLKCVVLEQGGVGGQVALTHEVENYPGFASVPGQQLSQILAEHTRQYADVHEFEQVIRVDASEDGRWLVTTYKGEYLCTGLMLATGATWKKLGAPGERQYFGKGVNYCATCDGNLYVGRKVIVVGGGNTALTDALYLANIGVDVRIVHRRDTFRAEEHLSAQAEDQGIPIHWNTVVKEFEGDGDKLTSVAVRDVTTGEISHLHVDGAFIAIGEVANADLAASLGLELTEDHSVVAGPDGRTALERVYACGDLTGGVRQIVTATGSGSAAAIAAFEDIVRFRGTKRGKAVAKAAEAKAKKEAAKAEKVAAKEKSAKEKARTAGKVADDAAIDMPEE